MIHLHKAVLVRSLLLSLLILVGLIAVPDVWACQYPFEERSWGEIARSDLLFLGRAVKAEEVFTLLPWIPIPARWFPGIEPNSASVVFEVEQWWRGSGRRYVRTIVWRDMCGILFIPEMGMQTFVEGDRILGFNRVKDYTLVDYWVPVQVDEYHLILGLDSLYASLGDGYGPSASKTPWPILVVIIIVGNGILIWRYRKRKLVSEGDA